MQNSLRAYANASWQGPDDFDTCLVSLLKQYPTHGKLVLDGASALVGRMTVLSNMLKAVEKDQNAFFKSLIAIRFLLVSAIRTEFRPQRVRTSSTNTPSGSLRKVLLVVI